MRNFLSMILLIALVIGGAYFGSPWWTVWNLEQAAKAGDAHAVAKLVDIPAVRASLTPQLTVQLQTALHHEQQKPRGLLDKLTMFASSLFAAKPVDTLVTPEGITYMIKTTRPPPWTNPFQRDKVPPAGQPALDFGKSWYMADDLDQFHAVVINKLVPGRAISLKLLRRGFMTWKVVGLDLISTTPSGASGSYAPTPTPAT
jgi:hypothetical protein